MGLILSPAENSDRQEILAVTLRIENFTDEEKETVLELWGARAKGYEFNVARNGERLLGYACYGERGLTDGTYDLFWIAVDPSARRMGVGEALLRQTEADIRQRGGRILLVETSGMDEYASTRKFYESTGYSKEAVIRDFYKAGDDLVIYSMHL